MKMAGGENYVVRKFCQVLFILSCKSLHIYRDSVLFCQLMWLKVVKSLAFACFFALKCLLLLMT